MHGFEKFLIEKGYIQHILNCKTMKYEVPKNHVISTMVNLDHRYIHKTDKVLLKKIEQCKSVMDEDFTWDDRKGVICFGLHEMNKPSTLINPRPKISVKKDRDLNGEKQIVIENENFDDSMNAVLSQEDYETIFKAMYDHSIFFEYNYLNKENKHDS